MQLDDGRELMLYQLRRADGSRDPHSSGTLVRRDGRTRHLSAGDFSLTISGGTVQGYGVKFFGPGTPMSGQNERSSPVVMQYIDGQTKIAWPSSIKTADPVLPLPKGHAYAR